MSQYNLSTRQFGVKRTLTAPPSPPSENALSYATSSQLRQRHPSHYIALKETHIEGFFWSIERCHMTLRQPYWCSKSIKRGHVVVPCWCPVVLVPVHVGVELIFLYKHILLFQ